jgi:hypothetical protein
MMTREDALERIASEFATAEEAAREGNGGKVRVCARRAAGVAMSYWLQSNPRPGWGVDALSQLRAAGQDADLPPHVREAAQRLTAKVTERFTSPFPTDPVEDSKTVIDHFLQK